MQEQHVTNCLKFVHVHGLFMEQYVQENL